MKAALSHIRVLDLSVNAPGPFASRMLADLGAEVTCVVNPAQLTPDYAGAGDDPMLAGRGGPHDLLARGKSTIALNLKHPEDLEDLKRRLAETDVLISEMRPGKLDALGLGWDQLQQIAPHLILCEITGYGVDHALAQRAGHDLNYMALSGALSLIRDENGKPVPPQNVIGDYAAGGTLAVTGLLAALIARERTGMGKHLVISMTQGIRYLISDIAAASVAAGHPEDSWRATLNGGMPTYDTYETSDGRWVAAGALEPKFIAILGEALHWPALSELMENKATWPAAKDGLTARFKAKPMAEWAALFEPLDACVTPVLSLDEQIRTDWPDLSHVVGCWSR